MTPSGRGRATVRGDLGKAPLDVTLSDARGGWKGSSVQRSVCRGRGDAAREPLGDGAELVHVEGVPQAPERLRPDGGLGTAKSRPTWQGCSSEGEGGNAPVTAPTQTYLEGKKHFEFFFQLNKCTELTLPLSPLQKKQWPKETHP